MQGYPLSSTLSKEIETQLKKLNQQQIASIQENFSIGNGETLGRCVIREVSSVEIRHPEARRPNIGSMKIYELQEEVRELREEVRKSKIPTDPELQEFIHFVSNRWDRLPMHFVRMIKEQIQHEGTPQNRR